MPYVSVIIPVYNAERTIRKCLLSLSEQIDKDFEIIIYNDGSTDDTLCVINEVTKVFDIKTTVVSGENSGVSHARNSALELASGEYVTFVDADDSVTPSFIHDFRINNEKFNADIYIGKIISNNVRDIKLSGHYAYDEMRSVIDLLDISDYLGYLHNKFYRRDIIVGRVFFPQDLRMSEDLIFNLSYMSFVRDCCIFDSGNYHYNDTDNSLSKQKSSFIEVSARYTLLEQKYRNIEDKFSIDPQNNNLVGKSKRLLTLRLQQWCAAIVSDKVELSDICNLTKILKDYQLAMKK